MVYTVVTKKGVIFIKYVECNNIKPIFSISSRLKLPPKKGILILICSQT